MASFEQKLAAGRVPCCVQGCQRTFKPDGFSEIICGQHWRAVPVHMRQRHRALVARYGRQFGDTPPWEFPAGSEKRLAAVRLNDLCGKAWRSIKKAATERSLGI